jgi:hypothetical protein
MNQMQAFHNWLVQALAVSDPRAQNLARLSRVSPRELAALSNDLSWETWSTTAADSGL